MKNLTGLGLLGCMFSIWCIWLGSAGQAYAAEHIITQKGKVFSQAAVTIRSGDSLVFKNEDKIIHNLFSRSDTSTFNLMQRPGEATPVAFEAAGKVEVRCVFHPKMKLVVTVE